MELLTDPLRRRWVAWSTLALVFLLVNVHRLSTAVLSEDLIAAFGITAAQLGTLHASFFLIYAIVQIPTGVVADRYGARVVGTAGAVTLSCGAIGFLLSGDYYWALVSRALIGLGSGVIFISILRFAANWYRPNEFATMTGLTAGIAGLGAIFATVPLATAIEIVGWRETILWIGLLGFVAGGLVFATVRRSPADAGIEPIEDVPEQPSVTYAETARTLKRLAMDSEQWLLSVVFFTGMGTVLTVIGLWGVPFLVVVYGLEVTTASAFTLLGAIGMLLGAPGVGWLSDRIGSRFAPMLGGLTIFTATLAVIPIFGSPPLFVIAVVYFLIGASLGCIMLALPIVKEKYPPSASGVATATVNGAGFFGGAFLPTAMGIALDRYRTGDIVGGAVVYTEFGYRVAFSITTVGVGIALCSAVMLYLRNT